MLKKSINYFKHILIHLISFIINYLIFCALILLFNHNVYIVQIINLIAWAISMLFIYYVDKFFFPNLINENNSKELYQFILIRVLGLILEAIILFILVSVLSKDYHLVKLVSLMIMFILNNFYVKRVKFK